VIQVLTAGHGLELILGDFRQQFPVQLEIILL